MSTTDEAPAVAIHNGVPMAAFPPPGWVVDVENPTRGTVLEHYFCFGILGTIALLALCQRFYVKIFLSKGLELDDLFIFLAWLSSMVSQCLMVHLIATSTLGIHTWEVPLQDFLDAQIVPYVVSAVYQLCNGFTKLSLLVFYLQISPQKWWKVSVWATIVFVALSTTVLTLMLWIHCDPVAKAYDLTITRGTCLNVTVLYMLTAVQNIATDIVLFALPIPMVLQLRMGKFQKTGAIIIFGIGSMTIGTSIVRLVLLLDLLDTNDLSWVAAKANVWIIVEANLFIICASTPTLRRFFRHVAPKLMGESSAAESAPAKYGRSYNDGLETVGGSSGVSRKVRRQYESFDDQELDILSHSHRGDEKKLNMNEYTIDTSRESAHQDSSSDKGILQTTTFDIKYNP